MNQVAEKENELTFKTEEEKIAALEEIQAKTPTEDDIAEIERITNAKVEAESEIGSPEDDDPFEGLEMPEKEEDKPQEEPKGDEPQGTNKKEEIQQDKARNWTINDELLSKYDETYVDEYGKTRPLFTHKKPEDLLKSYANSQKHIRYLETKRLPQEYHTGYEKAKTEYEEKLAELRRQLEEKSKHEHAQSALKQPQGQSLEPSDSFKEYQSIVNELSSIEEGDEIEHIDKFKKALALQEKVIAERDTRYSDQINQLKTELSYQIEGFKNEQQKQREREELRQKQEAERIQRENLVKKRYEEIDSWIKSDKAPPEARSEQGFEEMWRDADKFHERLAEIYTGKTSRNYSPQDWTTLKEQVGTAYLNGLPELVSRANEVGISKPSNYDKWVFVDNMDAIRSGYIRNQNNEWEQRYDQVTGKPISFPDVESAYNWWLDQTGKRQEKILEEKRRDTSAVVDAINRRDNSVVQLDESQMSEGSDTLTEEKATEILQYADVETAMQKAMMGDTDVLNRINAALTRLGRSPIEL